jgi:hypothetical protein
MQQGENGDAGSTRTLPPIREVVAPLESQSGSDG